MKSGDIVYHRRTDRGPFKVLRVGDYNSAWTVALEPGWFIHSGDDVHYEVIDDYEIRDEAVDINEDMSNRFDPWPMSPLGTTGKKRSR